MERTAGLIGRQREVAVLADVLLEGDGRLVLVSGDAGIGKSYLVGHVTRSALEGRALVVSCACLPLVEKLPLLPAAEALRQLQRRDSGSLLDAALDRCYPWVRDELCRLLPALSAKSTAIGGRADAGDREQLFSAIAELFLGLTAEGQAAGGTPLLLVVEDVHWADPVTLDLLTYLHATVASTGRLQLLATCRGDERPRTDHVNAWLTHMRRLPSVTEVWLGPFTREEVAQQVRELRQGAVTDELVDEVYARGQGSPFFTEQLIAGVDESRGLGALPDRLAELLSSKVRGVSLDAREVLAALAVAGRPLAEPLVAAATDLNEARARNGLREVSDAALLAPATADGAYRIRHALLAEAIRDNLLPGERQRLHARIAMTLEATHDPAVAAEVVTHWTAAGRRERALPASVAAARAAAEVSAYAEAARHWQQAIVLGEQHPEVLTDLGLAPPHLHIEAVDALEAAGRLTEAGGLAEDAHDRYGDWPDGETAARVRWRAGYFRSVHRPDESDVLLRSALDLFETTTVSTERAQALFSYAAMLRLRGDSTESAAVAGQACDVAEQSVGEALRPVWAAAGRANSLLHDRKYDDAFTVAVEGLRAGRQQGRGRSFLAGILLAHAVEAALVRGRTDQVSRLAPWIADFQPQAGLWPVYLALAGRLSALDRAAGANGPGDGPSGTSGRSNGQASARLAEAVERLRGLAGGTSVGPRTYGGGARNQHPDGRTSPQAWAAAAQVWQQLTRPQRVAYAQWRQAEALLKVGDRAGAHELLRSAERNAAGRDELANEITALALRARLPLTAREPAQPHLLVERRPGLTDRERSVLRLVTQGRTNSQIGAELYMSPKTASVHVTNIIRKLGVSNRVEAAAVAERAQLLADDVGGAGK